MGHPVSNQCSKQNSVKKIVFQAAIRNAEVEKSKAEARLAKLREGGISVDEYIDAFVYTAEQVNS